MARGHQRQLYAYSILWGLLSFAGGVLLTLLVLPEQLKMDAIPSWKIASFVWLNAHGVPIAEQAITNSPLSIGQVGFIEPNSNLHLLRVVPLLLAAIAGLLVVNAMKGARDDLELVGYGVYAAGGYIVAGLGVIVLSGARPNIVLILGLIAVLGVAVYLGSIIANSLPIPLFAVTSISGLLGIGLIAMLGASAVLAVAIPLGKHALGGGLIAVIGVWIGDNVEV